MEQLKKRMPETLFSWQSPDAFADACQRAVVGVGFCL